VAAIDLIDERMQAFVYLDEEGKTRFWTDLENVVVERSEDKP
jgi:hypothetical protein